MEETAKGPSELQFIRSGLSKTISGEGQRLMVALAATFLLGLIAHAFGFLNLIMNHDSMYEFYWVTSKNVKLTSGRFFEILLRYLMGEIILLPWLSGLTGLFFVSVAVHFLSKIFQLDRIWQIILVAGICVTNVVVTAMIATYIHDFAGDMLALLLCTIAAWAWLKMEKKFSLWYTLLGTASIGLAFCIYQAYLAVAVTAICLLMIRGLLRGRTVKETILHGFRGLLMVFLAFAGYMTLVSLVRKVFDLPVSTGVNGNDLTMIGQNLSNLWSLAIQGYSQVLLELFTTHLSGVKGAFDRANLLVTVVNVALLAMTLLRLILLVKERKIKIAELLLIIALVLLLPIAMSCVSIISTAFHNLLRYGYQLFYIFVLMILSEKLPKKNRQWWSLASGCLIALVIVSNIQISNMAYVQKDLEQDATLSTMTRVVTRLETQPEYMPGQTPVAILGNVANQQVPINTVFIRGIIGLEYTTPITYQKTLKEYFSVVLQCPINLVDNDLSSQLAQTEAYQQMPCFPAENSIQEIDGVLVVKLSD